MSGSANTGSIGREHQHLDDNVSYGAGEFITLRVIGDVDLGGDRIGHEFERPQRPLPEIREWAR